MLNNRWRPYPKNIMHPVSFDPMYVTDVDFGSIRGIQNGPVLCKEKPCITLTLNYTKSKVHLLMNNHYSHTIPCTRPSGRMMGGQFKRLLKTSNRPQYSYNINYKQTISTWPKIIFIQSYELGFILINMGGRELVSVSKHSLGWSFLNT